MTTLIVQLPARPRLAARHAPAAPSPEGEELAYVLTADGRSVLAQGRASAAQLPPATDVVALLPVQEVAWHRLASLPKAPAARLRAALVGVLEEALLADEDDAHLAVPPGAKAGEPCFIAVTDKAWLRQWIERLETTDRAVDKVVPAWAPDLLAPQACAAHLALVDDVAHLAWRDEHGPLLLPLAGATARTLLAGVPEHTPVRWSAEAEAADAAAELCPDTPEVLTQSQRLLAALASPWNLRQFELSPRRRSNRMARAWLSHALHDEAWRWVRIGLVLGLVLNLAGAGVWAWQQRSSLAQLKRSMTALLQTTFPQVRAIIDAPAQMQKELDALRAAAGRPGDTDLEPLLAAADQAWPAGRPPATSLHYETGRLTLGAAGWSPQEVLAFRSRLWPLGLEAEPGTGTLTLARLRGAPPQLPTDAPSPHDAAPGALPGPPGATAQRPPSPGQPTLPAGTLPPGGPGAGLPNGPNGPAGPNGPGMAPPGGPAGMAPPALRPQGSVVRGQPATSEE